MDTGFCVSALEAALARFGKPEIFNTDQGAQFTSAEFTGALTAAGIKISMDGKGRWMDNVFIERLWRSLKGWRGSASAAINSGNKYLRKLLIHGARAALPSLLTTVTVSGSHGFHRIPRKGRIETPAGLVRAPPALLTRTTVNRYLRLWGLDDVRMNRPPAARRISWPSGMSDGRRAVKPDDRRFTRR